LGKRLQDVLEELFDEPISDVWIARKYSEIIQQTDRTAPLEQYWQDESLLNLVNRIWEALELPTRKDIAPFIA